MHISICGQDFGTLSLHSSLERSNREFACPGESVTLTCIVNGTSLRWSAKEGDSDQVQIENFEPNSSIGSGFSKRKQFSCHSWITFTGALDAEDPNPRVNSSQLRKSSMIVTPVSENALSHCAPLTITCEPLNQTGGEAKRMMYQIQFAGESLLLYFKADQLLT